MYVYNRSNLVRERAAPSSCRPESDREASTSVANPHEIPVTLTDIVVHGPKTHGSRMRVNIPRILGQMAFLYNFTP